MTNIFMGLNRINTVEAQDFTMPIVATQSVSKTTILYNYPKGELNVVDSLPDLIINQGITLSATVIAPLSTEKLFAKYFPNEDYNKTLNTLAKVLYGECRGVYEKSKTNCACVIWCILNRVDKEHRGTTPIKCAIANAQFTGYNKHNPVQDHLRDLAEDVVRRWLREKEGETDVGRVLPSNYVFFRGKKGYNRFFVKSGGKRITPKHSEVYGD